VNGLCVRAAGAEDSMHPRRLMGASGRPLHFTVRRRVAIRTRLRKISS